MSKRLGINSYESVPHQATLPPLPPPPPKTNAGEMERGEGKR